jgi:hypothetical protein
MHRLFKHRLDVVVYSGILLPSVWGACNLLLAEMYQSGELLELFERELNS